MKQDWVIFYNPTFQNYCETLKEPENQHAWFYTSEVDFHESLSKSSVKWILEFNELGLMLQKIIGFLPKSFLEIWSKSVGKPESFCLQANTRKLRKARSPDPKSS